MKKAYILATLLTLALIISTYGKIDYKKTAKLTTTGNFYFIGGIN